MWNSADRYLTHAWALIGAMDHFGRRVISLYDANSISYASKYKSIVEYDATTLCPSKAQNAISPVALT